MQTDQTKNLLEAGRIIAIFRGDFGGREEEIVNVLLEAGITAVEVTLNSPGALDSIQRLAERFGSRMAVGAGTVTRAEEVNCVADAGGRFIVSPNRNLEIIAETKRRRLLSFPGCFTPSEILEALEAGADAAKVFPFQCLGLEFLKALRGPLPHARLIPTGGVTPEITRDCLAAGAWAVGVGSELLGRDLKTERNLDALRSRALAYVAAGRAGRGLEKPQP